MSHKPLVGFHASMSGGLYRALEQASALDCPTVQLFTKNNRMWNESNLTPEMISRFITTKKELKIEAVVSHASYLINLASVRPEVRNASFHALKEELTRSSLLEIDYVVLHPGSHTGHSLTEGINYLTDACNKVLEHNPSAMLLFETMAGQGSSIGRSFEELSLILEKIEYKKRVGICMDTCHIFAAGYPVATDEDYHNLMNNFDKACGLHNLRVIHINDSKKEGGSRVDRHEHIGEGKIALNFFKNIMNDIKFRHVPKILETPQDDPQDNHRNLHTLLTLIKKIGKEKN